MHILKAVGMSPVMALNRQGIEILYPVAIVTSLATLSFAGLILFWLSRLISGDDLGGERRRRRGVGRFSGGG